MRTHKIFIVMQTHAHGCGLLRVDTCIYNYGQICKCHMPRTNYRVYENFVIPDIQNVTRQNDQHLHVPQTEVRKC